MVRCLESEGVERIFAIPGEETLEIVEALRESPIEIVIVRHEQGAAFMADVHGRLTGRAGVCLGTLGPGATNLITGIGDAYLDYAPMVAITGQVAPRPGAQGEPPVRRRGRHAAPGDEVERAHRAARDRPRGGAQGVQAGRGRAARPAHLELSETIAAAELPSSLRPLRQERARAQPPTRQPCARRPR